MLQPTVRRTWAPRGQTPIHYSWDRHDRMSVIGALTLSPTLRRIGIYFTYQYENILAADVRFFLQHLHRHLQRKLILICDRWSVHRSAVKQIQQRRDWLQVEWLPPYAPDLNPVEAMWSYTKYSDLANYIPNDVAELENAVLDSLSDQHYDKRLKHSLFQTAQLDL